MALCQACDTVATKSESLREPYLSETVRLIENSLALPSPIGRTLTACKARDCLKAWVKADMSDDILEQWGAMADAWVDSAEDMEPWDVANPRLLDLPALADEADSQQYIESACACVFNEQTSLLSKNDAREENLKPFLVVMKKYADVFLEKDQSQVKRLMNRTVRHGLAEVLSAVRGVIGMLSSVPKDRNATPADVDFLLPNWLMDTKAHRRKADMEARSFGSLSPTCKIMQNNMARSKVWQKVRATYKGSQSIDQEAGDELAMLLRRLESVKDKATCDITARDQIIAEALTALPPMLTGPTALRNDGAEPLTTMLTAMLEEDLTELMDHSSTLTPKQKYHDIGELIELLAMVPKTDQALARAKSFRVALMSENTAAELERCLQQEEYSLESAQQLQHALLEASEQECTPAMAATMVAVRQKLLIGIYAHLGTLGEEATPTSLDPFLSSIAHIQKLDAVNLHLGGPKADSKLRTHILAIPTKFLSLKLDTSKCESAAKNRRPLKEPLVKLIGTYEDIAKMAQKWQKIWAEGRASDQVEGFTVLNSIMEDMMMAGAPHSKQIIIAHGVGLVLVAQSNMKTLASSARELAGGHPDLDGKLWTEGLTGAPDTWSLPQVLEHAERTLDKYDHAESLETAIVTLKSTIKEYQDKQEE